MAKFDLHGQNKTHCNKILHFFSINPNDFGLFFVLLPRRNPKKYDFGCQNNSRLGMLLETIEYFATVQS